jgi:hypothetical protein
MNFAGAKKDDRTWASRYVNVTLQNSRQQKQTERPHDLHRRELSGPKRVFFYLTGTYMDDPLFSGSFSRIKMRRCGRLYPGPELRRRHLHAPARPIEGDAKMTQHVTTE